MGSTLGGTGATEPRNPVGQRGGRSNGAVMALPSGPLLFAVIMFIAGGAFQVLEGIAALVRGSFFIARSSYAYNVDVAIWGWIQVVIGVVLFAVSLWLLRGSVAARFTAIVLAVVSAVAHFLFIPYQPIWAVLIIAVDAMVILALVGFESERI